LAGCVELALGRVLVAVEATEMLMDEPGMTTGPAAAADAVATIVLRPSAIETAVGLKVVSR